MAQVNAVLTPEITSKGDNMLSLLGDRDCLTIKDLYSGLQHCYPTKDKTAASTEMAIRKFVGDRKVK